MEKRESGAQQNLDVLAQEAKVETDEVLNKYQPDTVKAEFLAKEEAGGGLASSNPLESDLYRRQLNEKLRVQLDQAHVTLNEYTQLLKRVSDDEKEKSLQEMELHEKEIIELLSMSEKWEEEENQAFTEEYQAQMEKDIIQTLDSSGSFGWLGEEQKKYLSAHPETIREFVEKEGIHLVREIENPQDEGGDTGIRIMNDYFTYGDKVFRKTTNFPLKVVVENLNLDTIEKLENEPVVSKIKEGMTIFLNEIDYERQPVVYFSETTRDEFLAMALQEHSIDKSKLLELFSSQDPSFIEVNTSSTEKFEIIQPSVIKSFNELEAKEGEKLVGAISKNPELLKFLKYGHLKFKSGGDHKDTDKLNYLGKLLDVIEVNTESVPNLIEEFPGESSYHKNSEHHFTWTLLESKEMDIRFLKSVYHKRQVARTEVRRGPTRSHEHKIYGEIDPQTREIDIFFLPQENPSAFIRYNSYHKQGLKLLEELEKKDGSSS